MCTECPLYFTCCFICVFLCTCVHIVIMEKNRSLSVKLLVSSEVASKQSTVKPVLSGHSKRRPNLDFKTDYREMQVKSIAECSKRAFCNTFDLH